MPTRSHSKLWPVMLVKTHHFSLVRSEMEPAHIAAMAWAYVGKLRRQKVFFLTLPQERLNPTNEMPRPSDRLMFTIIHALWIQNTTNAVFFCSSVHQCTVVWVCFACTYCLCHSVHPLLLPRHVCSIRRCSCGGVARGQSGIHSML